MKKSLSSGFRKLPSAWVEIARLGAGALISVFTSLTVAYNADRATRPQLAHRVRYDIFGTDSVRATLTVENTGNQTAEEVRAVFNDSAFATAGTVVLPPSAWLPHWDSLGASKAVKWQTLPSRAKDSLIIRSASLKRLCDPNVYPDLFWLDRAQDVDPTNAWLVAVGCSKNISSRHRATYNLVHYQELPTVDGSLIDLVYEVSPSWGERVFCMAAGVMGVLVLISCFAAGHHLWSASRVSVSDTQLTLWP